MQGNRPIRDDSEELEGGEALDEVLRGAPAAMISIIVHLLVFILLALLTLNIDQDDPLVIEIGQAETQTGPEIESLVIEEIDTSFEEEVEETSAIEIEMQPNEMQLANVTPSMDIGRLAAGAMKGYAPSFAGTIVDAQRNGIEIVIVFDSTGSMGSEINAVKNRIGQIVESVVEKIPRARFSLVTYRDLKEAYVVRGIELETDVQKIQSFVNNVTADGGGDRPEAVQHGMRWALYQNDYRNQAQKVMLIFGDAPPHRPDLENCLRAAERFRRMGKGRVFTVTCRNGTVLPEFYSIARAGGGDAYLMQNSQRLMEDLLVIAFGVEHREEVLKFFEVKEPPTPRRRPRTPPQRRRL